MDAARRSSLARANAARLLTAASLVLLAVLAWAYLVALAAAMGRGDMSLMGMQTMAADQMMRAIPQPWTVTTAALTFLMWTVMMIGMMIPSALPMILLYARVQDRYRSAAAAFEFSLSFTVGYLAAWAAFSLVATGLQWALSASGLLAPMTMSVGGTVGAGLFAAAGLYQLSPLKDVCLRHCRSPAEFLALHQRRGLGGAFVTGAHHGLYCVGCCWLLMALLFAVGVMNLLWVAALAVFILLEKLVPNGRWFARAGGVVLVAVAVFVLIAR